MELFKGLRRLLKPTGVVWLNLGGTFYHAGKVRGAIAEPGLKPKDLIGTPWRVVLALQADGWFLRSDVSGTSPTRCRSRPLTARSEPTRSCSWSASSRTNNTQSCSRATFCVTGACDRMPSPSSECARDRHPFSLQSPNVCLSRAYRPRKSRKLVSAHESTDGGHRGHFFELVRT